MSKPTVLEALVAFARFKGNQKAWVAGAVSSATTLAAFVAALSGTGELPPAQEVGEAMIFAGGVISFGLGYVATWAKSNR